MKFKSKIKDLSLFALLYSATIVGAVALYTYLNFGIVTIDKFLSVLNEVFYLDWAVKKIQIYSFVLLFVALLGTYFLKPKHIFILSALLFLLPVFEFDIISYFRYKNTTSTFYEENYVEPKIENKIKNNLIVIYLESFEKQFASEETSPFFAKLAKENISFDGFEQVPETFSTIHAQFASLCGISLSQKSSISGDGYINFFPNIKCIPDLLKNNGYSTAYLKAANINFSRANYFAEQHNFDIVKGFSEFKKDAAKITKNYSGNIFGGLKDRVFFELAKKELSQIKEPFFVTLTTLDMHGAPDVYYDPDCEKKYNDVRDAASCTGKSVENFLNWLKNQPFGKRTTVLIAGDHQMASKIFSLKETLNVFLNSAVSTENKKRKFTSYDLAPSMLEAMGYNVAEFGIGRSLFRDNKTLFEKDGNKFKILLATKNKMIEELKKFNNTHAGYKIYQLGNVLNNDTLYKYTDFGQKNNWCNQSTYLSMTLNKAPKNSAYLKMKYIKANSPFSIFVNDSKIYENVPSKDALMTEQTETFKIPDSIFKTSNKISIKFDYPYNNVNGVFGLCIKEFVIDEKE